MNPPEGFLLVDKPPGPTSHDIVDRVRRVVRLRQVGHAGTLDPFASGLLILGIGKATKQLSHLVGLGKTYEAMFVLGGRSTTDDRMGAITFSDAPLPSPAQIEEAMEVFRGDILQIPPTYSAIKIGGKKMYKAARAGKPLEAPPRPATVYAFDLAGELEQMTQDGHALLRFPVLIRCSSGTYVRALARDLGERLGTGGYVAELRRTEIGPFQVQEALNLETLASGWEGRLKPVDEILKRVSVS